MPRIQLARVNAAVKMRTAPIRFSHTPARTIWTMVMCPEPNTMAFGGVATGIIKAQVAARAAGIANDQHGSRFRPIADPGQDR